MSDYLTQCVNGHIEEFRKVRRWRIERQWYLCNLFYCSIIKAYPNQTEGSQVGSTSEMFPYRVIVAKACILLADRRGGIVIALTSRTVIRGASWANSFWMIRVLTDSGRYASTRWAYCCYRLSNGWPAFRHSRLALNPAI